ncbi:MAG: hypothetical protein ACYTBZ_20645 [Planctomycetota bacterium]
MSVLDRRPIGWHDNGAEAVQHQAQVPGKRFPSRGVRAYAYSDYDSDFRSADLLVRAASAFFTFQNLGHGPRPAVTVIPRLDRGIQKIGQIDNL